MSKGLILLEDLNQHQNNVMLFTDIHGHSINDNIFMYGNKGNTPEETENIKEIPNLMNQDLLFRVKERISRNKRSMLA